MFIPTIILFSLIGLIGTFADEPKPLLPIEIQQDMKEPIQQANKDIELANVKKTNIILQLRLILKVPNEYSWNENLMRFDPPVKKEEPKSPPKNGKEKP